MRGPSRSKTVSYMNGYRCCAPPAAGNLRSGGLCHVTTDGKTAEFGGKALRTAPSPSPGASCSFSSVSSAPATPVFVFAGMAVASLPSAWSSRSRADQARASALTSACVGGVGWMDGCMHGCMHVHMYGALTT